jgi:DNA-binding NtrC family response regulator
MIAAGMAIAPPARILVIDDDPGVVELLREFLEKQGYAVDSAPNSREGLSRIVATRPDLVLLDIRMPDMDGMRALQLVRTIAPALAVIMVTANEDIAMARETLRVGAVDYVAKPLDLDYLARAVAAAVGRPPDSFAGL